MLPCRHDRTSCLAQRGARPPGPIRSTPKAPTSRRKRTREAAIARTRIGVRHPTVPMSTPSSCCPQRRGGAREPQHHSEQEADLRRDRHEPAYREPNHSTGRPPRCSQG